MTDLNDRIDNLETIVDDLQLELHAAKSAIVVLSSIIDSMGQKPGMISANFEEAIKSAPELEFDHPASDGYKEQLYAKILTLLGKVPE
ncbi:hypothetical protein QU609_20135 [Enterobacter hormaechei subsp. hoffmannii]|uniref:hypothetical protein n=1 Tax=Enterobacter hormaechei TaxID=158836 RepID=UPI00287605B7|nr:hypothetical protein [Enterobacter hormaechei]MDS0078644.1 hypothetical protein [Enterobacter hormaechei subsp. hoffmannii]HBM2590218.1 hypothetical protein [Enterobacter hormaechei subsp. hoffmannii]